MGDGRREGGGGGGDLEHVVGEGVPEDEVVPVRGLLAGSRVQLHRQVARLATTAAGRTKEGEEGGYAEGAKVVGAPLGDGVVRGLGEAAGDGAEGPGDAEAHLHQAPHLTRLPTTEAHNMGGQVFPARRRLMEWNHGKSLCKPRIYKRVAGKVGKYHVWPGLIKVLRGPLRKFVCTMLVNDCERARGHETPVVMTMLNDANIRPVK